MATTKILLPLDGSPFSRKIIPDILRIFPPTDTELTLLRVVPEPEGLVPLPPRPVSPVWLEAMYATEQDAMRAQHPIYASQAWESVQAMLDEQLVPDVHALREAGYNVSVAVAFGDPAREIVDFVGREGIDMVAMTTHGRSGLQHMLLGSVAEKVLRRLDVPVLLLRPFNRD